MKPSLPTLTTPGRGCAWGDFDGDGDADLFVSCAAGNNYYLYRNNGNGTFTTIAYDAVGQVTAIDNYQPGGGTRNSFSAYAYDAAGNVVAQQDGPPAAGILPTNLFFGTPLPDSKPLSLPADLPPGEYQLQVVAYAVETVTPVGEPLLVGSLEVRG